MCLRMIWVLKIELYIMRTHIIRGHTKTIIHSAKNDWNYSWRIDYFWISQPRMTIYIALNIMLPKHCYNIKKMWYLIFTVVYRKYVSHLMTYYFILVKYLVNLRPNSFMYYVLLPHRTYSRLWVDNILYNWHAISM